MKGSVGRISARPGTCNFPFLARERERGGSVHGLEQCQRPNEVEKVMAPRKPALPEGTDHVVRGASAGDEADGAATFVAAKDKLVGQVREQVSGLRSQATSKARGFADDGKAKATGLLNDVSEVIGEAAEAIDRRFGEDYGDYA